MKSGYGKVISVVLAVAGLVDAAYLTYEHFSQRIVPCSNSWIVDCGKVLNSEYSTVFGIPLSLLGVFFYLLLLVSFLFADRASGKFKLLQWSPFVLSSSGLIASAVFMYLQLGVIGAICLYCTVSAAICFVNFFVIRFSFAREFKQYLLFIFALLYQVQKRIFFLLDPEYVHHRMTNTGELLGRIPPAKLVMRLICKDRFPTLEQTIQGIRFATPIGLSAGFDYEAKLTQVLEPLGFGFQSVGTITNLFCEGNNKPRLGRLPKSKSLLVNKGFRNPGAEAVVQKLQHYTFAIPVGISIGRTNTLGINTVDGAIEDICQAFNKFEQSNVKHSYYELNISCPNLKGSVSFYDPPILNKLLQEVLKLKLKKPIFIKMPIELDDFRFLALLKVIGPFPVAGIIVGNLQKDRTIPELDQGEVAKLGQGNLSGKATWNRSNELIALAYKTLDRKYTIIGCGGVFSAEDAFQKIKLGASLIQLITGMIFQGPQLIAQINYELDELLKKKGYKHVSKAVGSAHR